VNKLILILLIILSQYPLAVFSETPDLYFIDAHSQADSQSVLRQVIPLMDQAGVRLTILSGRRKLVSSDISNFAGQHPQRIIASIRTKGRAYEENRDGYYKNLENDVGSGRFGAIAELLLYHAQKGGKAGEIVVYPDDERVRRTLEYAKKKGWPLVVHIEFASLQGKKKTKFMDQFERMLDRNPEHPFALIHMGQLPVAEVQRLIESHGNIYFMTSHTNPVAISKSGQPWAAMFKGDGLAPEWQALVIQYSDRFILAFDNVWPDQWGDFYLQEAAYWRKALAMLPSDIARAIAHGNAERLWKISYR